MRIPDFEKLSGDRNNGETGCHRYCPGYHPNPYFYKYYWWVFHKNSPCDGHEFLTSKYRMNLAEVNALLGQLEERQELCWLYNQKLPRFDPDNAPWDPGSPVWEGTEWAPPFDEDPDPVWDGHK